MENTALPIIGITGYGLSEFPATTSLYDHFFSSPALYAQSIVKAGGIPIVIPPIGEGARDLLQRLDGIIFSGGGDIDPAQYGGNENHSSLQRPDKPRDSFEITLIKQAVAIETLPILGICRGVQMLNVALGGTLIEHLPDHIDEDIHRGSDGLWTKHDVSVNPRSKLARIMQAKIVHTQSGHHQALNKIAPSLKVVATSNDGVVEAVEHCSHPWCIGVQWHPETTALNDVSQQRLFEALVLEAKGNLNDFEVERK